jgi:hypothetical protein
MKIYRDKQSDFDFSNKTDEQINKKANENFNE